MHNTPEIRMPCSDDIKFEVVKRALAFFRKDHKVVDVDGARVSFPGGWGLVRASNTGPVLVLRCEADGPARLAQIRAELEGRLQIISAELKA